MKKNLFLSLAFALLSYYQTFAQSTTMSPNYVQIPNVITLPACSNADKGKTVFNTTDNKMYYCNSNSWVPVQNGASGTGWASNANDIYNGNTGNVGIGTSNPTAKLELKNSRAEEINQSTGLKLPIDKSEVNFRNQFEDTFGGFFFGTTNVPDTVEPTDFAMDSYGNLFIIYKNLNRISKIGGDGIAVDWINGGGLNQPSSINIDINNNIYITNMGTNSVLKITQSGVISTFATGFNDPVDLTFFANGDQIIYFYVVNQGNEKISRFDPIGNVLSHTFGSGLILPTSCTLKLNGSVEELYVYDYFTNQIVKFDPDGTKTVRYTNAKGRYLNYNANSYRFYHTPLSSTGQATTIGFLEDLSSNAIADYKEIHNYVDKDLFQFAPNDNILLLRKYSNTQYYIKVLKAIPVNVLTISGDGTVKNHKFDFKKIGLALNNVGDFYSDRKLGIKTLNPIAPLHVAGQDNIYNLVSNGVYFGNNGIFYPYTLATPIPLANKSAIFADGTIISNNVIGSYLTVVSSDNRIKKDFSLSNNSEDLERLRKIQITNYRMKDVATWGDKTFKKVIAQQVEEVYPEVINKTKSVIPDIYALAESVAYDAATKNLSVTLSKDYTIKVGEKLELVHPEKGKIQAEVVEVNGKTFTVKDWNYATDKIFVFGREVNDFRSVDYEALSMLGISAIQQLAKENEEIKRENAKQKEDFNKRLEGIEASLKALNKSISPN
jgi:Chaperone of endosialidase